MDRDLLDLVLCLLAGAAIAAGLMLVWGAGLWLVFSLLAWMCGV